MLRPELGRNFGTDYAQKVKIPLKFLVYDKGSFYGRILGGNGMEFGTKYVNEQKKIPCRILNGI
jgi:hypothetical protein